MVCYQQPQMRWLNTSLAIVLALGICLRFTNLDQKPYWHDEIYTSLRASGYTAKEATQALYNGQIIEVETMLTYQRPSSQRTAIDTLKGLATEEPHHPPLYYVMARFWAEWFGSSITAMRSLPALISLLALPAMYWLCRELFASPMVGNMAVALLAVSPIYIRYAQEARQYSLWVVLILLSSTVLIRAVRHKAAVNWGMYAIAIIAALYCHLLSVLVVLGHGVYVLAIERFRLSRTVLGYLLASLMGMVWFLPWVRIAWINNTALVETTAWMKQPLPLPTLVRFWGVQLSRLFVAWDFRYDSQLAYLAIPILGLVIVALRFLCRHTPRSVWLFILTLIGVTALALVLPDVLWAGKRSTNIRYFFPSYLGLTIAIAYLMTHTITLKQRAYQLILVVLISSSLLTSTIASQASTWWGWSEFDVEVSSIINQSPHPLVISDMPLGLIMPLAHRLQSDTQLILVADPDLLHIPTDFTNVFIYNPSDRLQSALKQRNLKQTRTYQFEDNGFTVSLYRLTSSQSQRGLAIATNQHKPTGLA